MYFKLNKFLNKLMLKNKIDNNKKAILIMIKEKFDNDLKVYVIFPWKESNIIQISLEVTWTI